MLGIPDTWYLPPPLTQNCLQRRRWAVESRTATGVLSSPVVGSRPASSLRSSRENVTHDDGFSLFQAGNSPVNGDELRFLTTGRMWLTPAAQMRK